MRSTRSAPSAFAAAVTFALLCTLAACRDEQAGPHPRGSAERAQAPLARPATAPAMAPAPEASPQNAVPTVLDQAPADLTYRSGATFADHAIQYLGARVTPAHPRPGEQVLVQHFFTALKPPPQGYGFFMHIVDPASGRMLANADHEFAGGTMPLAKWPLGKVVVDQNRIPAPQSPARIMMGFWQGDSRLPVDQANQQDGENRVLGPVLGPAAGAGDFEPLPEYRARRASRAPVIDGELSDPGWKAAPEVTLRKSFDGTEAELKTRVRLLYDDQFLYVAFDCEDPDLWGTLLERDAPIYSQEVVEIFLDANADLRTYNELEVSPNNVVFDAYFPARRQGMDTSWDSKMQTAVKLRGTLNDDQKDQGWSVEMKIPYAALAAVPNAPPRTGDKWRFNLYRLDLPDRRTQHGQAFSPLFIGDFHALPRFGWLVFDGK